MAGKIVVLKPMAWNRSGYMRPEGIETPRGYVGLHGFGHEEWNGNPARMWKGQRIFHSETTDNLTEYGKRRELGLVMTAYDAGRPYALGVATSVRANTSDEMVDIARDLDVTSEAEQVWRLPSVRKRHPDWAEFKAFWVDACQWIAWRCPPSEFMWFEKPILLDPSELFPPTKPGEKSPDIVKMHGRFMAIRPDQALAIVRNTLDTESPIVSWLSTGGFDDKAVSKKTRAYGKPSPSPSGRRGGSAPPASAPFVRYMQTYE